MGSATIAPGVRSIFGPVGKRERAENFESYLVYLQRKNGELLESERALAEKQQVLARFRERAVRARRPLPDPDRFYRNYVVMRDDPRTLDRTTLLLTFLYKFARHEWVGISAAWDATPTLADSVYVTDKISRYHLAEEFGHMRLFHEMLQTFGLDRVEWVPLAPWVKPAYELFTRMPSALMASAAFVSELMGFTVYLHLDQRLDAILADEPEAREQVRALLYEIAGDELGHVGLRRNYLGPIGRRVARGMIGPMFRGFLRSMPESALLFDIRRMVKDAQEFDYNRLPPHLLRGAWVPSYFRER
jgi:hypothetical protein